MPSDRLNRNLQAIQTLSNSKRKQRDILLQHANRDLIDCVCDCAHNILKGNVPLKEAEFKYLNKYRCSLRKLSNKKLKSKERKDLIINQRGGFLPQLLIPVISVASSLLADAIIKK